MLNNIKGCAKVKIVAIKRYPFRRQVGYFDFAAKVISYIHSPALVCAEWVAGIAPAAQVKGSAFVSNLWCMPDC